MIPGVVDRQSHDYILSWSDDVIDKRNVAIVLITDDPFNLMRLPKVGKFLMN